MALRLVLIYSRIISISLVLHSRMMMSMLLLCHTSHKEEAEVAITTQQQTGWSWGWTVHSWKVLHKEEYSQLTKAQKLGLKLKRKKRSPDDRDKSKNTKVGPATLNKASIKALASELHQLVQSQADTEDETVDTDEEASNKSKKVGFTSNRNNSAFRRKKWCQDGSISFGGHDGGVGVSSVRTRLIGTVAAIQEDVDDQRTELDNHADTCVVGEDTALIIHDFDRPVRVFGYNDDVGPASNCKTGSGGLWSPRNRGGLYDCDPPSHPNSKDESEPARNNADEGQWCQSEWWTKVHGD
jgi:hypothetical protein